MTVDLSELLPVLAAATVVVAGIAGALVAIRRWIRNVARPAQEAADQLTTSNGHTVGQFVEQVAEDMTAVRTELGGLATVAAENRSLAQSAITLAQHTSDRLDAHLGGHQKHEEGT